MIEKITTGFLVGNLFNDVTGIDEMASAEKYRDVVQAHIEAEYPDAEVEVHYQRASGALPFPLKTAVYADVELSYSEEEAVIQNVDYIMDAVYQNYELWVVETEEE